MTLDYIEYEVKEKVYKLNKRIQISEATKNGRFRFYSLINEVRNLMTKRKENFMFESKRHWERICSITTQHKT